MNLNFNSITIKNFRSYGNNETTFNFENGLDLITGTNGKGKTTMFLHAIVYNLYGDGINGEKVNDLINKHNKKDMLTTLLLKVNNTNYKIIRGRKPNLLKIYSDDEELVFPSDKEASIYIIETILNNIDKKTFLNIFAIQANRSDISIFRMDKKNRRDLLESLFDVSIYKKMKTNLQEKIGLIQIDRKNLEIEIKGKNDILLSLNNRLKNSATTSEEQINTLQKDIDTKKKLIIDTKDIKIKINKIEQSVKDMTFMVNDLDRAYSDIFKYVLELESLSKKVNTNLTNPNDKINKYNIDIDREEKEIQAISKFITEIDTKLKTEKEYKIKFESYMEDCECLSICIQKMSGSELTETEWSKKRPELLLKRKDLTNNVYKNKKDLKTLEKEVQEQKYIQKDISKNEQSIKSNMTKFHNKVSHDITIEDLKDNWKIIKQQINDSLNKKNDKKKFLNEDIIKQTKIETEIKNLTAEINRHKKMENKNSVEKEIKLVEKDKFRLNQKLLEMNNDFETKNELYDFLKKDKIKFHIMRKSFPMLKKIFNKILNRFFYGEIKVDISKEFDIEIYRNGEIENFEVFSEGEKKRLDLAFIFTIHEFLSSKNQVKINLFIMDELLDSALDSYGIESVVEYLDELKDNMNIILVTHKSEPIEHNREYVVKKIKKFSQLSEI